MRNPKRYWAAEPEGADVVDAALEKHTQRLDRAHSSGFADKSRALIRAYYGLSPSGGNASALRLGGEQGEVVTFSHNAIRPLVTNALGLIAGQRPGLKAVARNTDSAAVSDSILADALREYTDKKHDLPQLELDTVRGGLIAGCWGLFLDWERTKGAEVTLDPDTGRVIYEGDIVARSLPWWDFAFDTERTISSRRWVIFRRKANIFELAADYPSKATQLLERPEDKNGDKYESKILEGSTVSDSELENIFDASLAEDEVWLWEFRHLPTAALPAGRLVRFVDRDTVLFDTQNVDGSVVHTPYNHLFAYEYSPEKIIGTSGGHTGHFDLLATQHLLDVATSSIATGLNINGTPMLWNESGNGLAISQIAGGPQLVVSPRKPESIDMPAFKPDVANVVSLFKDMMRESAAVNQVVAGTPDKGMPAQAMAMLRAQAVQYYQVAQGGYFKLVESLADGVLGLYKAFAKTKRVAEIAGTASTFQVREWSQDNLEGIARYALEPVNPLLQSYEGRLSLGEQLFAKGAITLDGYLALIQTGTLKEPLEAPASKLALITKHKELLRQGIGLPPLDEAAMQAQQAQAQQALQMAEMQGIPPPPIDIQPVFKDDKKPHVIILKTDPHWDTYEEYNSVLNSPEARRNPQVVQATLDVLDLSLKYWAQLTPDELAALGGKPLPSAMMPPMPAGGPEMQGGAPAPASGDMPGEPKLPSPPKDPTTGQAPGPEALNLKQ